MHIFVLITSTLFYILDHASSLVIDFVNLVSICNNLLAFRIVPSSVTISLGTGVLTQSFFSCFSINSRVKSFQSSELISIIDDHSIEAHNHPLIQDMYRYLQEPFEEFSKAILTNNSCQIQITI